MSAMRKLRIAAGATVVVFAAHAYEAGIAVGPAHRGATSAAIPAAISGPVTRNANEALANQMATAGYGWRGAQLTCLDELWTHESGFRADAVNAQSGALGIPQALGHGTAGTAGKYGNEYGASYGLSTAEARAANNGDAASEVKWGLGYVRATYRTPCGAWDFEMSHTPNWY